MNEPTKKELEENRYLGTWDNVDKNTSKLLMGICTRSKINRVKYNTLLSIMCLNNEIKNLKRVLAFYYDKDKEFYDYSMERIKQYETDVEMPKCVIEDIEADQMNVFCKAVKALEEKGLYDEMKEMKDRVNKVTSYEKISKIISDYVDIVYDVELENNESEEEQIE